MRVNWWGGWQICCSCSYQELVVFCREHLGAVLCGKSRIVRFLGVWRWTEFEKVVGIEMKVLPNMSHMSRRRKMFLVLLLLALVCTARHWCAALLDGVRHTVDLSFTIEWGPTYWVDDCMAALGRPGVGRLCATTVDDRKHVAYGANSALGVVALRYDGRTVGLSLFNEKCYVKKKSLFGQFELLIIGRLGKVSGAR